MDKATAHTVLPGGHAVHGAAALGKLHLSPTSALDKLAMIAVGLLVCYWALTTVFQSADFKRAQPDRQRCAEEEKQRRLAKEVERLRGLRQRAAAGGASAAAIGATSPQLLLRSTLAALTVCFACAPHVRSWRVPISPGTPDGCRRRGRH